MTLVVLELFRQLSNRLIGHHHFMLLQLTPQSVPAVLVTLQKMRIRPAHLSVTQREGETESCELSLEVTLSPRRQIAGIYQQIMAVPGVRSLDIS